MRNNGFNGFTWFAIILANTWFVGTGTERLLRNLGVEVADWTNFVIAVLVLNIIAIVLATQSFLRSRG